MKKNAINRLLLVFMVFTIMPVTAFCAENNDTRMIPIIPHQQLLTGNKDYSDKFFDYYETSSGEYAVALKETFQNINFNTSNSAFYDSTQGKIVVPGKITIESEINGHTVTGIWHNAFHGNPTATIELPDTITVIDYEAFLYSGITSIEIPYTIKKIGAGAFYSCNNLVTARIQNNNRKATGAACYCESFSSGDEYAVVSYDNGLSSAGASEESTESSSEEPLAVSAETSGEDSSEGGIEPEDPTVWCRLEKIPSFCFFRCSLMTSINLPKSITEIEQEAFHGCYSLSSGFYFENIRYIRSRAFQGCSQLRKVSISPTMFDYDEQAAGQDSAEESDESSGSVEKVAQGFGVIEPHAFNYCHDELEIDFCTDPDSITEWLRFNPDWGWKNENNKAVSSNHYHETQKSASNHYSADWTYSVSNGMATIISYEGDIPLTNHFLSIPDYLEEGNNSYPVTRISSTAFNKLGVKEQLYRLYLPTTLLVIEAQMFDSTFTNLKVIKDNRACVSDSGETEGQIDLHRLKYLEFLGYRCFSDLPKRNNITKIIWLPANLIAVGDESFCRFTDNGYNYKNLTEFKWDYSEKTSRLEVIGMDAFFRLGYNSDEKNINAVKVMQVAHRDHKVNTLVLPKTFRYFGFVPKPSGASESPDHTRFKTISVSKYNYAEYVGVAKTNRPAHCFALCPLIGTVVFKGSDPKKDTSAVDDDTTDLIIPLQTFTYNESLQTIIFEERYGHFITFHTQNGGWEKQSCIGGNAGAWENDFRGDPYLQTLVLPNKYTTLRIQPCAFMENSRAAIYLTAGFGNKMIGNKTKARGDSGGQWTNLVNSSLTNGKVTFAVNADGTAYTVDGSDSFDLTTVNDWRMIATEDRFPSNNAYGANNAHPNSGATGTSSGPYGLYFNDTGSKNTFGIKQLIPYYPNIHYKDVIDGVPVEVGDPESTDELYIDNINKFNGSNEKTHSRSKCAYVCHYDASEGNHYATMSKYLYNLADRKTTSDEPVEEAQTITTKARVRDSVRVKHKVSGVETPIDFTVKKIGESAFSCCYAKDYLGTLNAEWDLTSVELPDSITHIGEYAFLRAYRVATVSAYTSGNADARLGEFPASLESIGKNAFSFCGITKALKIPDTCLFFENEYKPDASGKTTSVFSNCLNLRQISFGTTGASSNSKYSVTQYTSSRAGNPTFVSALYSETTTYNSGRLLLVLNRDQGDITKTITGECTQYTEDGKTRVKFTQGKKNVPFLFGAYKMGLWINHLDVGKATMTKDGNGADTSTVVEQPLFSAVCTRAANGNTTEKPIYLGKEIDKYTSNDHKCDLMKIDGAVFDLPTYALSGCEQLKHVDLRYRVNGALKDGVFLGAGTTDLEYATYDENNEVINDGTDGTLDLRGTGYISIGDNTFKQNNAIKKIIAPASGFTIGAYAFSECSELKEIDFSEMTGDLTLGEGCFSGCGNLDTVTWPTRDVVVDISASKIFEYSGTGALTTIDIPAHTTDKLGDRFVAGREGLTTVTVGGGSGTNSYIKTIGGSSFSGCSSLNFTTFPFSSFTYGNDSTSDGNYVEIKGNAFQNTGTSAVTAPNLELPSNYESLGGAAFSGAKIATIVFSSSSIDLGSSAFENCTSLTAVRFKNSACNWKNYNKKVFNGCTSLEELQLPSTFTVGVAHGYSNNEDNGFIWGDTNVKVCAFTHYTSGASASNAWLYYDANNALLLYWLVGTESELTTAGVIGAVSGEDKGVKMDTVCFWKNDVIGGVNVATPLGTVTDYSAGIVVFSTGWQLNDSIFTGP